MARKEVLYCEALPRGTAPNLSCTIYHSLRTSSRAPRRVCLLSIDKCDPFHIPSLENSVLLTPVNAPSFKSEYDH